MSTDDIENQIPDETRESDCRSHEDYCRTIRCPYGVRHENSPEGCTVCACENPCEDYQCNEGQKCAVDLDPRSPRGDTFIPVCREISKPGECPPISTNSTRCERECYDDSDCRESNKCCSDGCGMVCVPTYTPSHEPQIPQDPVIEYPGDKPVYLEHVPQEELDVKTTPGDKAVLRCFATGHPPPTISWSFGTILVSSVLRFYFKVTMLLYAH